jgi:hypothetical protein
LFSRSLKSPLLSGFFYTCSPTYVSADEPLFGHFCDHIFGNNLPENRQLPAGKPVTRLSAANPKKANQLI